MPRVILAPATRADAAELIRGNLESREHHHPWATPFTDQAGFDAWLGRTLTGPHVGLVVREATSGGVVGVVNLMEIVANPFYQGAYLGYYGLAALAGRGLMTEAVRLATVHAFQVLGLHRLEANIQPSNARSIALVKRLGFRLEGFSPRYLRMAGEWRDHERWALLADEIG
jgi:[ribosomal protein S5]-alanine N-acetyltransferase